MPIIPSVAESPDNQIKWVKSDGRKKAILKGGRLGMYPAGFRIYRASRGIQKPDVKYMYPLEAQDMVYGLPCQYESTVEVTGEHYHNVVNTRYYNKKRWYNAEELKEENPFLGIKEEE